MSRVKGYTYDKIHPIRLGCRCRCGAPLYRGSTAAKNEKGYYYDCTFCRPGFEKAQQEARYKETDRPHRPLWVPRHSRPA